VIRRQEQGELERLTSQVHNNKKLLRYKVYNINIDNYTNDSK
jgi:hypothetical protein